MPDLDQITVSVNDIIPPENFATIDKNTLIGTVYTKAQDNEWRATVQASAQSGIKGILKPNTPYDPVTNPYPTPWVIGDPDRYEKYDVNQSGTFVNTKDFNNNNIIVTPDDIEFNEVQIWVKNGVSELVKKELPIAPKISKISRSVVNDSSLLLDSWATAGAANLIVKMPDINYSDGAFFDMKISISNISDVTSKNEDNSVKLRFNSLIYPNILQHFSEKVEGNLNIIKTYRLMKDPSGIISLVFEINNASISVYRISVSEFTAFSGSIDQNNYKPYSNITFANEINIPGYTLIKDYTNDELLYKNKKIAIVGDSITDGYDDGNIVTTYLDLIKRKFQTNNVQKFAKTGGTIANNNSWSDHIFTDARLAELVSFAPDLIIIMAGVNDYQVDQPIGVSESDRSTTVGSLAYSFEYLKANLPNSTILFCTSGAYHFKPNFMSSVQSGRMSNNLGKNLKDYFDACLKVCQRYSIPALDFYSNCGWFDFNENIGGYEWTTDGLHFSYKAYEKLTDMQLLTLKTK